ncbi:hypothetical protein SAMN06265795_10783 [Noviherbaspirillum humi]|uniref:DUF1269 domain-containing protein n=1 Tax=Noviherbaspirillum humi TaxID=1688639 RepID=A0A239HNC7_9BURK|nr:hypothetical protein [Noviherbaspirillum humi]SNS82857.1 hypothetical protein SAMN06265795_10783 [Noviherbaspirillum humi]
MRHRLFYLYPEVAAARRARDLLLLNRIEDRRIHFLSRRESLPGFLRRASALQTTDVVHGAELGMLAGAIIGFGIGVSLADFPFFGTFVKGLIMLVSTLIGLVIGGWLAGMVAVFLPNSRIKALEPDLEQGRVLMIADVPARRVQEIEELLGRDSDARFAGEETHFPGIG